VLKIGITLGACEYIVVRENENALNHAKLRFMQFCFSFTLGFFLKRKPLAKVDFYFCREKICDEVSQIFGSMGAVG
jgi:hypothetical protein